MENQELYSISNEYDMAEIIRHFDSNMIIDIINDKLNNINYAVSLPEPNIISAFEAQFKVMEEQYAGDAQNIRNIRESIYRIIIDLLCNRFNLQFNTVDDTIDLYMAAYYIYDFLVCNRNNITTNFFTAFIINNKDSLYQAISYENGTSKSRDITSNYGKLMYSDKTYVYLAANMVKVLKHISTLDITLLNIFQSTYSDVMLVQQLDNTFADKGNFFRDHYCSIINNPDVLPVVVTNIKLQLQQNVGNISPQNISSIIDMVQPKEESK